MAIWAYRAGSGTSSLTESGSSSMKPSMPIACFFPVRGWGVGGPTASRAGQAGGSIEVGARINTHTRQRLMTGRPIHPTPRSSASPATKSQTHLGDPRADAPGEVPLHDGAGRVPEPEHAQDLVVVERPLVVQLGEGLWVWVGVYVLCGRVSRSGYVGGRPSRSRVAAAAIDRTERRGAPASQEGAQEHTHTHTSPTTPTQHGPACRSR